MIVAADASIQPARSQPRHYPLVGSECSNPSKQKKTPPRPHLDDHISHKTMEQITNPMPSLATVIQAPATAGHASAMGRYHGENRRRTHRSSTKHDTARRGRTHEQAQRTHTEPARRPPEPTTTRIRMK
jgi:hypothetical protein